MSDADCTPGRERRSVAASIFLFLSRFLHFNVFISAVCNSGALYFCPVVSSFLLLFSSPNLSRRKLDVCHTCTHGVALVRIQDAGLKPAARGSLEMQDAKTCQKFAIWAPSHNLVGLYILRN